MGNDINAGGIEFVQSHLRLGCSGPRRSRSRTGSVRRARGDHRARRPGAGGRCAAWLIERHGIDYLYLVPTMMVRIWRLPAEQRLAYDLSSLRIAFHMAAPCAPWLKRAWIGWLGPEQILELYSGAAPKSAQDNWESLGDMGFVEEDGYVHVTDRDSDMILLGGAKVYPAEVEAALEEHSAVCSACVIGLPDEDLGAVPHDAGKVRRSRFAESGAEPKRRKCPKLPARKPVRLRECRRAWWPTSGETHDGHATSHSYAAIPW